MMRSNNALQRMPYSLIAGLVLTVASLASAAQDVVRVKFIPAYPMPDQSMEALDLEIKRLAPGTRGREVQIDRYFAAVIKILDDEKITSSWERSVVHAPFVRVEVAVAGRTITLGVSYSSNGLDSFPGPDDSNERHRRALDGILKLTLARVADRWPSK